MKHLKVSSFKFQVYVVLKKLLIALLPLGTIAVAVWLVFPEYNALQETKAMREEVQKAYKDKKELIIKIKDLEDQYADVGEVATKIVQIIPHTPDIPNLLVEVPEMALQHGLVMGDISFSVQEGENTTQPGEAGLHFRTMDANLTLAGSFEAFRIFLMALEKELRIMDIQSIQFAVPRQGEGNEPYNFVIRVRMYYGLET